MVFLQTCVIDNCGEVQEGEDDGISVDDGTGDVLPYWPTDSDLDLNKVCAMRFPKTDQFLYN